MQLLHSMLETIGSYDRAMLALAALASPFVALFAALRVSRAQTRAAIAGHRQNWIDELRDELASTVAATWQIASEKAVNLPQEQRLATVADKNRRVNKIKLLLNPAEEDHRELAQLLDRSAEALVRYLGRETKTFDELGQILQKVERVSQAILKREWNRVKTNE